MEDRLGLFCLGLMGLDPTDLINLETYHLLFKYSNMEISDWNQAFRSWPSVTSGVEKLVPPDVSIKKNWLESIWHQPLHWAFLIKHSLKQVHAYCRITFMVWSLQCIPIRPWPDDPYFGWCSYVDWSPDTPYNFTSMPSHQLETKNVGG